MPTDALEHFSHVDQVVDFIKQKLPTDHDSDQWKNICEDILHCHLSTVEPMLMQELARAHGQQTEEDKIRGLLRATSWYKHPQLTTAELLSKLNHLKKTAFSGSEYQSSLSLIESAVRDQQSGYVAHPASQAIEKLLTSQPSDQQTLTELHELRDQIYYQLLYPHWFEIVKNWHQTQNSN